MRKLSLFALTAAAIVAATGSPLLSQASAQKSVCEQLQKDNCIIVGGTVSSKNNLKDVLSKLEKEFGNCNWNSCIPDVIIPDNNLPETPETETPGTEEKEDTQTAAYTKRVVELVNVERAKAGLKELTLDKTIEAAATVRAKEIEKSFSHTRPDGSGFSTALKEQGVTYSGAGENIAWGQTSPEAVVNAWMNSEGHRANILNSKFTKIGVGHYQNAKGTNYWAQLFTY